MTTAVKNVTFFYKGLKYSRTDDYCQIIESSLKPGDFFEFWYLNGEFKFTVVKYGNESLKQIGKNLVYVMYVFAKEIHWV